MSSLKDLASLIMVPSLVKDGRLDTVKPLGNSIIHPDATGNNDGTDGSTPAEGNFTFSRGSNLAATRVDVNGLIEKGRENLLLQSNQFDTTWNTFTASVTEGQAGYDGSCNAWVLDVSVANGSFYQSINQNNLLTASIYAKKGTANGVRFRMDHNIDSNVYVDTIINENQAKIKYNVSTNTRYLIDSISIDVKSRDIDSLINYSQKLSLLKENEYFSITN